MENLVIFVATLIFVCIGSMLLIRGQSRSTIDVCRDLEEGGLNVTDLPHYSSRNIRQAQRSLKKYKQSYTAPFSVIKLYILFGGMAGGALSFSISNFSFSKMVIFSFVGISAGYLFGQRSYKKKNDEIFSQLEQFLPVVMERLVMAVQSGLDVIASVHALVELELKIVDSMQDIDPVTELLDLALRLTELGASFQEALNDIADKIPCTALKHVFVHLALAYEEGGEIVVPLRELSEATQLQYQESVEERIAKMPVKATLPLVCTFAGLIVCFITTPLLQVMNVVAQATIEK